MYGGGIVIVGIAVMHEHLYCIVLLIVSTVYIMLNKITLGVKKVQSQSEAALQIGMYDQKR